MLTEERPTAHLVGFLAWRGSAWFDRKPKTTGATEKGTRNLECPLFCPVRDIYVADTDEQAWKEAPPEIIRFWQLATDNFWRGDSLSADDLPKFTERFPYFPGGLTVKRLDEWGTSLIGSPETVSKKAREMLATAQPDCLVGMFSFGGLKHEQVMRSIELFATKVMPALGA